MKGDKGFGLDQKGKGGGQVEIGHGGERSFGTFTEAFAAAQR